VVAITSKHSSPACFTASSFTNVQNCSICQRLDPQEDEYCDQAD
jgi:hypothetical protein